MKKIKLLVLAGFIAFMGKNTVHAATYQVKTGDSLYTISKSYNTNSDYLKAANNLSSNLIYPGQSIQVPTIRYTVKAGDSLYLIAKGYGVTLSNLRFANGIWTDALYVGQVLTIPTGGNSTYVNPTSAYVISCTSSEVDLLARLINAEAGGESYSAMESVGAVIVNRVKNSTFPNTITKVIYDTSYGYYQFTPVANGMINKPATTASLNAAKAALSGLDPTHGALYFYDNTATNSWLRSKTVALVSGKLIFAY
ncbi:LysM peptidoglycan-binding domain-containing protein [Clostridium hydrogenum]|uniref:LysM peptidoglycan-binding domain-containing protein n=1 Tax=Clostridium hydrogenum TaxID=2855764 RepID=UPI001F3AE4CE|nr:LysM peptidoglycan-binding domain-containing protein [Clostridium hydrogenum]